MNDPIVKMTPLMLKANMLVHKERARQNQLWGHQRHDLNKWLGILMEEVGEFAQTVNAINFGNAKPTDATNALKEIVQVSAVARAIAEQLIEEQEQKQQPCNHEGEVEIQPWSKLFGYICPKCNRVFESN
ncbi:hypothetical protein A8F94_17305 [Bacillus sp. FJAT-27225]|uniref:hypothetical protein n=1 Tax=Bacillus sp. FJAT-27225 TaxID=1743144 RepID=UPI00080C355C|nr:hypothetical protein [Bacillus sp. FJAT-27225]OCA84455.1 hypothetical protein A8F94_17305 [Bacillus sp. FJAT-27225]